MGLLIGPEYLSLFSVVGQGFWDRHLPGELREITPNFIAGFLVGGEHLLGERSPVGHVVAVVASPIPNRQPLLAWEVQRRIAVARCSRQPLLG